MIGTAPYGRVHLLLSALLIIVLTGCTFTPIYKGVAQQDTADYVLGLTIDEALRVVEVAPNSAAQTAGMEVGDMLVSLTWILSEAPEALPTTQDGTGQATIPLTVTVIPLRPPAGVEYKTYLFSEPEDIASIISYGAPMRLEIIRNGQPRALTIIPQARSVEEGRPTATPVALPNRAF